MRFPDVKYHDLKVKIISIKGDTTPGAGAGPDECPYGHRVGDEWFIAGTTPEGMCHSAFNAIYPSIRAMRFGAEFPWSSDKDIAYAACPDITNPIVFEIKRIN